MHASKHTLLSKVKSGIIGYAAINVNNTDLYSAQRWLERFTLRSVYNQLT